MKNNRINSLEIGLLILLAAILLTFFTFSRKNSQNKNTKSIKTTPTTVAEQNTQWQTYTNQRLGFSVDYPNNWQTKEFSRDFAFIGKSKGVAFGPVDPNIINKSQGLVTIEIEDNPKSLTVDDFIDNYLCDSPGVCASSENATQITLSEVKGKRIINPPAPVPSQVTILINNNQIFRIAVTLDRSFEETYTARQKEEIYNRMLNSFRFTE